MKQSKLVILAMVSLTMASCMKEHTIDQNKGKHIGFRSSVQTRAAETNITNLNDFHVTTYVDGKVMFKDVFSKQLNATYESVAKHHWNGDKVHSFYAYAPSSLSADNLTDGEKKMKLTPATDIQQQIDFICASATGTREQNEADGVPLVFYHSLSQISIQAKNANKNYTYEIKGFKISHPVASGTYDFGTKDWTLDSDKAVYEFMDQETYTLSEEPVSLMKNSGVAMLLPQTLKGWDTSDKTNAEKGAYLSVYVQIKTKEGFQIFPVAGGEYGWASASIDTEWKAGNRYVYTLDFTDGAGKKEPGQESGDGENILGKPIKFTVKVEPWKNQDVPIAM